MFSFAGDTILDPFSGSGSTAVAAIRAGRNSLSIEIETEYLNVATRRAAYEASSRLIESHTANIVESISMSGYDADTGRREPCQLAPGSSRRWGEFTDAMAKA
jgi:16S rRNA G966 N2-methylase RsmD